MSKYPEGWPGTYWLEETNSFASSLTNMDEHTFLEMREEYLKQKEFIDEIYERLHKQKINPKWSGDLCRVAAIYRAKVWWIEMYNGLLCVETN